MKRLASYTTILAGIALSLMVGLLGLALTAHVNFNRIRESAKASRDYVEVVESVRRFALEAETGQRGFLLTGEEAYLAPYLRAQIMLPLALTDLRRRSEGDASEEALCVTLISIMDAKWAELASTIALRRSGSNGVANAVVDTNRGRDLMERAERVLDSLSREESDRLQDRRARANWTIQLSFYLVLASGIMLIVVVGFLLTLTRDLRMHRALTEQIVAEKRLLATSEQRALAARADAENARMVEARRTRQTTAVAEVAVALNAGGDLHHVLSLCCKAAVDYLDAAVARVWTMSSDEAELHLEVSAGPYADIDRESAAIPVGKFNIGLVAKERRAHVSNDLASDSRMSNPEWTQREGMVSFAGYPLIVENRCLGVFAMFSRRKLMDDDHDALALMANQIALGIERKRIEVTIRESEERYRFMSDLIPEQVWTAKPSGALDYVNRRVLQYFGRGFEQMIGEGWQAVVHPDDLGSCVDRWVHCLQTGEPYEVEFRLLRAADAQYRWHIAHALPLLDENEKIIRWFGTNVDIEDRKASVSERERLIGALTRSNRELDQFAHVASHDLKAPLRGIANLSLWIEEDLATKMTDETREQMRLLRGRVGRMEALIDGILNYARANRGEDQSDSVNVRTLVGEIWEMLAPPSTVTLEINGSLPTLQTARVQLQQVLLNLLSNAIKHAGRNDPKVSISVGENGEFYDFCVSDNGAGIEPQYHDRIWGLFQTLQSRDKVDSTGIGLSVVKKIVEARGGRAWVESSLGNGATFHFLWPRNESRTN